MDEIPASKIAGGLLIFLPMILWASIYFRYSCLGGICKIPLDWLLVGFAVQIFGIVLILMYKEKKEYVSPLPPKTLPPEVEKKNK